MQKALTPAVGPVRQPLAVDALARGVLTTLETARPQLEEPAILRRPDGTSVYEIAGSARYSSPEIPASLALRDGDPTAIAYYNDHGRIRGLSPAGPDDRARDKVAWC